MIIEQKAENITKGQAQKKKLHLLSAFVDERTRYIDRACLKKVDSFPERMNLKECSISTISLQTDTHNPGARHYLSLELATVLNTNWVKMTVWMTFEELEDVLNHCPNGKVGKFVASFMEKPAFFGSLPIREWLGSYLHMKGIDIELIQAKDHEIPRNQVDLYTTKGLIEFLRWKQV